MRRHGLLLFSANPAQVSDFKAMLGNYCPPDNVWNRIHQRLAVRTGDILQETTIVGMLFMLHMEHWHPVYANASARQLPNEGDLERIRRLNTWTCCLCFGCKEPDCDLLWNFAGQKYGIWGVRRPSKPACKAFMCWVAGMDKAKHLSYNVDDMEQGRPLLLRCSDAWWDGREHLEDCPFAIRRASSRNRREPPQDFIGDLGPDSS